MPALPIPASEFLQDDQSSVRRAFADSERRRGRGLRIAIRFGASSAPVPRVSIQALDRPRAVADGSCAGDGSRSRFFLLTLPACYRPYCMPVFEEFDGLPGERTRGVGLWPSSPPAGQRPTPPTSLHPSANSARVSLPSETLPLSGVRRHVPRTMGPCRPRTASKAASSCCVTKCSSK